MRVARYNRAYKRATDELWNLREKGELGKHGKGLRAIASKYNVLYLSDPGDRRITKSSLDRALRERMEHGVSPPKLGRPESVPTTVTDHLAVHTAMMQAAGEGEATTASLKQTLVSATASTKRDGTFSHDYAVKKSRRLNSLVYMPVKSIGDEDRRME